MSISSYHGTAQIIPFVPRARLTRTAGRGGAATAQCVTPQPHTAVDWEAGWYHEAAIQEAARQRRS